MSRLAETLLAAVASLLDSEEREVVLGDLREAGEGTFESSLAVLGLFGRRQLSLCKSWNPWLAAFGLALPGSFLLMGFSVSVSLAWQQYLSPTVRRASGLHLGEGFVLLLCNLFLLAAWSWAAGFVSGALSRRTLWVTTLFSLIPCVVCLERFRVESLSRLCLLLFAPFALWGAAKGLRFVRLRAGRALALALTTTALTIPLWQQRGAWLPNWALSWPAWYLVVAARRAG